MSAAPFRMSSFFFGRGGSGRAEAGGGPPGDAASAGSGGHCAGGGGGCATGVAGDGTATGDGLNELEQALLDGADVDIESQHDETFVFSWHRLMLHVGCGGGLAFWTAGSRLGRNAWRSFPAFMCIWW